MGRQHTPTRVDIRTSGWTSGLDVLPLPRQCQTATCHHKDHQLRGTASRDAAFIVDYALTEGTEPFVPAYAPPSGYDYGATKITTPVAPWPQDPPVHVRIARRYYWSRWMVLVMVAGGPETVIARWWDRKTAQQHADMIRELNQDVYERIKDHVAQHGR